MNYINKDEMISQIIFDEDKWAVLINNHLNYSGDKDPAIWEFVYSILKEEMPTEECFNELIVNVQNGGLFFFEKPAEATKFFFLFMHPNIFGTGLNVNLFAADGSKIAENI